MQTENSYTFEITNRPHGRDHALYCLNMRPDDFVKYDKSTGSNTLDYVKSELKTNGNLSFLIPYEDGQPVNQVLAVRILDEAKTFFVQYGLSAPINGSLAYAYGNMFPDLLRFLSSRGYSKFSTGCLIGHGAEKAYRYHSVASEYNYIFKTQENGVYCDLTIDLVNLKGDI